VKVNRQKVKGETRSVNEVGKIQALFSEKKPLISQGLKNGAGEEGRTPDLMLGKHTL
jgi:hypothetical protein